MRDALMRLAGRIASTVTRAKLALAAYDRTGGRTMVQVTGLAGEVMQNIELLLPYGRSALPIGTTADLLVLQVNGNRDHKLALACDDPALRIPDLERGEFGDRDARGQQVVYRTGWIELTTPSFFRIASAAAPGSNPPAGSFYLYIDPADQKLKVRGSNGTISTLASP